MVLITSNQHQRLLYFNYVQRVTPQELESGWDGLVAALAGLPPGFRLLADPDPAAEQMRFTLDITDDRGRSVQTMGTSAGGNYYSFQLMDLRRTKTLNVTLALHKSRFVEFTVKPQKASGAGAR